MSSNFRFWIWSSENTLHIGGINLNVLFFEVGANDGGTEGKPARAGDEGDLGLCKSAQCHVVAFCPFWRDKVERKDTVVPRYFFLGGGSPHSPGIDAFASHTSKTCQYIDRYNSTLSCIGLLNIVTTLSIFEYISALDLHQFKQLPPPLNTFICNSGYT